MKLLIIGFAESGHMGGYLAAAARQLGLDFQIVDANAADASTRLGRSFYFHFRGRRPARLSQFGAQVLDICARTRPDLVLTTGRAPLGRSHIEMLRARGIQVANYSTDDPWNPALSAPWFSAAIPAYDAVFTTRRANVDDFRKCGVRAVYYLPFGYDPDVHRPWSDTTVAAAPSDVLFVGGCDSDRLPMIVALIDAGFRVALFGGYWDRHSKTRPHWRGIAHQDTIRCSTAATRVSLCLVRRANRDGHVMRSFEAAAIGGCILAEDTIDHRELFGPDNHAVWYFNSTAEMVQQVGALVADSETRRRLSVRLRERFADGRHTYADRLGEMLRSVAATA